MKTIDIRDCHEAFGRYIKVARERKGLSQEEVAEMAEMSQSYYSRIENGQREIDLAVAIRLCASVGTDIRDFINRYL